MEFHEYTTFRTHMSRNGDERQRDFARKSSSHDFRKAALEWFGNEANTSDGDEFNQGSLALAESVWTGLDRPYYNVWPVVVSLASSVKLSLLFSQVTIPFHGILLRFARGHEPHYLRTALLFWPKGFKTIQVFCHFADEAGSLLTVQHAFEPNDTVEEWLLNLEQHGSKLPNYQHAAGLLRAGTIIDGRAIEIIAG